jgi:Ser/Thr protein kinase RdoA (MazF antagonist)
LAAHPPDIQPLPPAPFNRDEPPGLAQWDEVLDRFGNRPDPPGAVRALERGRNLVHALPPFEPVTRAVLHGDPKLENALFDERGQALAWIDLDTLRHGFLIHELADGVRSWAGLRAPDDRVHLSRDCFLAAREAYRGRGLALTAKEWRVLPCALAAQALGLALRYLEDAFEPAYFAWDQARYPSPAEQNRRRGEGLLTLAAEALQLQSPDPSDPFTIDKGSPL